MTTLDTPSSDCDEICLTPGTVFSASSIFLETSLSTDSGPAPGQFVVTVMIGRSTLGNSSIDRRRRAKAPRTTNATMIIVMNTGRLIERSERTTSYLQEKIAD